MRRILVRLVALSALSITTACGDASRPDGGPDGGGDGGGDGGAMDAGGPVDGGAELDAPIDLDAPRQPVVRGTRYCEILLAFLEAGAIRAEVWGTQGLNDCPAATWEAIDQDVVRTETGATLVVMNGPRYWLPDRTMGEIPDRAPAFFGGLLLQQLASIMIPLGMTSMMPYTERTILRDTRLEFDAGREVYELLAPDGSVYVMQAYAQIVDATLSETDLPTLDARITLPSGWAYRARTLDTTLVVATPGMATVLQDDLQNTYSLLE